MASLAPFGLSVSQKHVGQTREYIIRSSDTNAYGIGDPVKSTDVIFQGRLPDGRPTQGMPGATKAASGDRIRGVIVGMAPAQIGTDSMSIPATKARDYVVLVNDDPRTVYEIQANNTAILGVLAGSYANFVTASPAGSVSGIYLDATSFNAASGDVRVLSVEKNENANSVLRVLFVFHEDSLPLTAAETAAVQSLVSGDGMVVFPRATLTDTLLLGNNATVWIPPGAVITNGGTVQHTMIRTGNAEFASDAQPIPGVSIYCADEVTAGGTGTLRYTHATTSLAWLAPGASGYGAEVDISGVTNAATVAIFTISGASAGQALHVYVAPASRSGVISRTVRLEPVTGARGVTWTRASNVRTVSEAGHGRRVGDFVIGFDPAGDVSHGYITAVTANTYTFPDTGTDQGSAQTGRAYGVRNITIIGNGATLDYNRDGLSSTGMSNLHAVILNACSDVTVERLQVNNCTKYACLVTGFKKATFRDFSTFRTTSSDTSGNSDVVHPLGPGRGFVAERIRAQGGDNIIGVGCSDYYDYVFNCPAYGDLSLIGGRVTDTWSEDSDQQPVRFYNANGANWIKNWTIDGVFGTYEAAVDSAVAIIMDTASGSMVDSGQTNIDGLTIISPDAVRSDGSASYAIKIAGAGTRKNIRAQRVRPRAGTAASRATVWVELGTTTDDLSVEFESGDFSGYLVGLTGTANVGRLTIRANGKLTGNNELGGGHQPVLCALDSSTSVLGYLDAGGLLLDDVSTSGTKLRGLFNNGTVGEQVWSDVRCVDGDALSRNNTTAAAGGTIRMRNVTWAGDYVGIYDGGAPGFVDIHAVWHNKAANALLTVNDPTARNIRVRAVNCKGGGRFLRNVQANHVWYISGYGNEPGSAAAIVTDAGTPSWRLDGDWDLVTDGALLDATVANHRAGAKFYNSNAAFGVPGVGSYVRGSAAWVRVAA